VNSSLDLFVLPLEWRVNPYINEKTHGRLQVGVTGCRLAGWGQVFTLDIRVKATDIRL